MKKDLVTIRGDRGEFGKLFFVENLCPYNQSIYDECYNLKKNGDIDSVWVYHGIVNIKHTDSKNERPTRLAI